MEGWIKLHRKFLGWEWFNKPEMVQLFMYLLLKANYEPKQYQNVSLNAGQLITTNPQIRKDTGLTEQQIRTCLNRLKSTGEITYIVTKRKALITLCKYDSYQINKDNINGINNGINNGITTDEQRDNNGITTDIQRNKEDNNLPLPRARERDKFDECFNALLNCPLWIENVLRVNRITPEQFTEYLKQFFDELRCRGETYKSEDDAKFHFHSWLKIELEKQQKKQNGTIRNKTGTQQGNDNGNVTVREVKL